MIRFLVDTSSDYTVEEIRANGMELAPLHITIGEADYRDGRTGHGCFLCTGLCDH